MRRRGRLRLVQWRTEDELRGTNPAHAPLSKEQLVESCRRLVGPDFERGDFVGAGRAFGLGITSDVVALALAHGGAGGVLAQTLPSGVRDSLLRAGLAVMELGNLLSQLDDAHDLIIDFETGTMEDVTRHHVHVLPALRADELSTLRAAPSLAAYGLAVGPIDPDVYESKPAKPVAKPTRFF